MSSTVSSFGRHLEKTRRDPAIKAIGRARDVRFAAIGVLAIAVGVYAVFAGWPQWWIPLGAGAAILVAVALGGRLHDRST